MFLNLVSPTISMKTKRGVLIFLALAIFLITLTGVLAEPFSIQALVESEWVNAALIFLLVFNVVLFVVRDIFRGNYGATIIISIIVALASSLGAIYYFGPFLAKVGLWLLVIFVIAIALLLFRLARKSKAGGIMFWILGLASIAWLAFLHNNVCPPVGSLPQNICQVLDVLAIIILIICFIRLIIWLFKLFGVKPVTPTNPGRPGNLAGFVRERNPDPNRRVGISGASVEVHGGEVRESTMTDDSGHYGIPLPGRGLFAVRYAVRASASGYSPETHDVGIRSGRTTPQDFYLKPTGPGDEVRLVLHYKNAEGTVRIANVVSRRILAPGIAYKFKRSYPVYLQAKSNPGFNFIEWTITQAGNRRYHRNPLPISIFWQNPHMAHYDTFDVYVNFGGGISPDNT